MKKLAIIGLGAAVVVGGGFYFWNNSSQNGPEFEVPMQEVTVEARTIENLIVGQGSLEPLQEVEIGFTVSGIVDVVNFEIGDEITKGDILAELDPSEYESQLQLDLASQKALEADRRDAVLVLEAAEEEYGRALTLQANRAVAESKVEQARRAVATAQIHIDKVDIQIEQMQLTIEKDRNNISKLQLIAPFDGIVTEQPFQIGQSVSANDNSKARVSQLSALVNRAKVAEADIADIRVGMEARLTTLGGQDRPIAATVSKIEPTPVRDGKVVLYNVLLQLDNSDLSLFNGMTTQVFFTLGRAENVPTIPVAALIDADNAQLVELKSGEMREVETGLRDRLYVEIKSGLEIGDVIMQADISPFGAEGFGGGRPR